MEGTIVNYRSGKRTQDNKHFVIETKEITKKSDATKLIGKTVEWVSPSGKKLTGKVSKSHGNSGAVLAIFEKGLPGQALGTKVEVK